MVKKQSRYQTKLRECRSKVKYHSSADAWASAELLRRQNPGHEIDAYVCRWCNGWHVGHRIGHPLSEPIIKPILHERAPGLPGRAPRRTPKSYLRQERQILYREYAKQGGEYE